MTLDFKAFIDGNILKTPGTDWNRPLQILKRRGRKMLVRRAGHTGWNGRGVSKYFGTLYMVLELKGARATVVKEATPGRKWREVLPGLLKEVS